MGQGYLLDTNSVICFLEGTLTKSGKKFIPENLKQGALISIITKIELLVWNPPAGSKTENLKLLINNAQIYPLDEQVADKTVLLRKTYRKLKLPDAIIAATALCYGFHLITRNRSDFGHSRIANN